MPVTRSFSIPVGRLQSYDVEASGVPLRVEAAFDAPVWLGWLDDASYTDLLAGASVAPLRADVGDRFVYRVQLPAGRRLHLVAWNREGFVPLTGTVTLTGEGA